MQNILTAIFGFGIFSHALVLSSYLAPARQLDKRVKFVKQFITGESWQIKFGLLQSYLEHPNHQTARKKMDCPTEQQLSVYLDGQLSEVELIRIYEHLLECRECCSKFEELRSVSGALQELPRKPLPPGFLVRLQNRFHENATSQLFFSRIADFLFE